MILLPLELSLATRFRGPLEGGGTAVGAFLRKNYMRSGSSHQGISNTGNYLFIFETQSPCITLVVLELTL